MDGRDFLNDAADLVKTYHRSVRTDFESIPPDRIWERSIPGQVSPANLVLHIAGNLRHFIGHLLGGIGFSREREREFVEEPWADHGAILALWDQACSETRGVLQRLDEAALSADAPVDRFPGGQPTRAYILWLLSHMAYHAGQIRTHYRVHNPTAP